MNNQTIRRTVLIVTSLPHSARDTNSAAFDRSIALLDPIALSIGSCSAPRRPRAALLARQKTDCSPLLKKVVYIVNVDSPLLAIIWTVMVTGFPIANKGRKLGLNTRLC